MWIIYAFASAFFAGITAVFAKIGIRGVDTNVATAIRTSVVFIFACAMALLADYPIDWYAIGAKAWFFLALSGCATGISWICYFKALDWGDINQISPIDKMSTVLTMFLAYFFLGETMRTLQWISIFLILAGSLLMLQKQETDSKKSWKAIFLAFLSACFAALTAIFGKLGISDVPAYLGTAIRTFFVLWIAWGLVVGSKSRAKIREVDKKSAMFIVLSGISTGSSWLLYYKAIQMGNVAIIAPIDKLSILVSIAFAYYILKEKISYRFLIGLICLLSGILLLLL